MKSTKRILIVLAVACSALCLPGVARAGTYMVTQPPCRAHGWVYGGELTWPYAFSDNCSGNVTINAEHSGGGRGFAFWKSPKLPSSAYISGGAVYGLLRYMTTNHGAAFRSCWHDAWDLWYGGCGGNPTGYPDVLSSSWGWHAIKNGPRVGGIQIDVLGTETKGAAVINALNLQVTENSTPVVTRSAGSSWTFDVPSGAWDANAWQRGTKPIHATATDANGLGVKSQSIFVDGGSLNGGVTIDRPAGQFGCSIGAWTPCPSSTSWSTIWDTAAVTGGVPDGAHSLTIKATDAAGNEGVAGPYGFRVDNTPPSAPDAIDVAGETSSGWRSVNDFDVSWVNPGETVETATQSGIESACYDVDPAEGQSADPAEVCVADPAVDSIDGIVVPEDGLWNLKIHTRDAAGNESRAGVRELRLDTTIPGKPNGVANGWIGLAELISGKEQIWSSPSNRLFVNSGLCGYGFSVTRDFADEAPTTINVTGDVTSGSIPPNTPEGENWAHFRAISCAGLYGPTETVAANVDLTNPTAEVSGIPESGWTNRPGAIDVAGSDAMPGSGLDGAIPQHAVNRGASVRFDLDGATVDEVRGAHAASYDAAALAEGEHSLTVSTFDVARNHDDQTFSFGVDKTAPGGAFLGTDPEDPATFRVAATDALSGVTGGEIQYAPVGAGGDRGAFKPLATTIDAGILSASFPDTKLPAGSYALRAEVRDVATNTGYATKSAYGREMVITTPLREAVRLNLLAAKAGKLCRLNRRAKSKAAKRRAAKRYRACKRRLAADKQNGSRVSVAYGRRSVLNGRLADRLGEPMANVKIELYEQRHGAELRHVGGATTDQLGRFDYTAHAGPARNVIAYFPGNRRQRDVSTAVTLDVPAKVSFRVSPGRVKGARRFALSGKVFAHDGVSAEGKLVQLQFYNFARRRWQAGPALVRAGRDGKFRYVYAIKRSAAAREKIRFRAFVPAETSFPYGAAASRSRTLVRTR